MTYQTWCDRKDALIEKIEVVLEVKRKGRKPKSFGMMQQILSDGDLRRRLTVTSFMELEQQVHFWL